MMETMDTSSSSFVSARVCVYARTCIASVQGLPRSRGQKCHSRLPWAHYAISCLRPQSICWAGSVTEPFHGVTPPAGGRSAERGVCVCVCVCECECEERRDRVFTSNSENVFDTNHDLAQDVSCVTYCNHSIYMICAALHGLL